MQAGDNGDNVSDPSNVIASPAQDRTPPVPPTISGFTRVTSPASITVHWTIPAGETDLRTLVQRRQSGAGLWQTLKVGASPLGTRLPLGAVQYHDTFVPDITKSYEYRLNVINTAGNVATSPVVKRPRRCPRGWRRPHPAPQKECACLQGTRAPSYPTAYTIGGWLERSAATHAVA